jgi:acetyl-CoA carboxylase biotin carboxyl carrier protein
MVDEAQLEAIRRLLKLAERYALAELEVEESGLKVMIRGEPHRVTAGPGLAPAETTATATEVNSAAVAVEPEHLHLVHSPLTGTFYRAPAPDAPPYAEIGMPVEEGQPIGVLEAMKVFSDVPADCAGTLVEFRVRNGQLVQTGDPLVVIDPLA